MGRFIISERKDGQLIFHYKTDNGQTILSSEGYSSRVGIESAIGSVKKNARHDSHYIRSDSNNGYSFRVRANNGQITGLSERYVTRESRERAIEELKRTVENATTEREPARFN